MRLYENPYVYVRTRVMKTLLLTRQDYDKIMKMGVSELSRFLEESAYRKEIDENASKVEGGDLLEISLNANLVGTIAKLKRMSDEGLKMVIDVYMKRWDIENVKIILRAISTSAGWEDIGRLIIPLGGISREALMEMYKSQDIIIVLGKSGLLKANEVKDTMNSYKEKGSISIIENILDQKYYNDLLIFARNLKGGLLFKDFLAEEIEAKNIVTLLRLRKNNVEEKVISGSLIKISGKPVLPNPKMQSAKSVGEMFEMLKSTHYSPIVEISSDSYGKTGSLMEFESMMKHHLLAKTTLLSHQYPLSIDVILGYMFAKELEVSNLKTIVRGKLLGVDDEFISRQLVVA